MINIQLLLILLMDLIILSSLSRTIFKSIKKEVLEKRKLLLRTIMHLVLAINLFKKISVVNLFSG